jgi:hypothetical protein
MGRGRRSEAALLAQGPIIPGQRPPPDPHLDEEQAKEWRKITGRLPSTWFRGENLCMLVELCRHITYSRFIAAEIARMRQNPEAKEELRSLLRAHGYQSERIGNLSTKLRLTLQSRYDPETAAIEANKTADGPAPWLDWGSRSNN